MTQRTDLVAEARTWLETPFHHQARVKGEGVDCIGLVIGVARSRQLVAADFDVIAYSSVPDGVSLMRHADANLVRVDRADMQLGDVVVLVVDKQPQHFGILADYRHGGFSIIHAHSPSGRVVETRLMFSPAMRFVQAYRFPGVM